MHYSAKKIRKEAASNNRQNETRRNETEIRLPGCGNKILVDIRLCIVGSKFFSAIWEEDEKRAQERKRGVKSRGDRGERGGEVEKGREKNALLRDRILVSDSDSDIDSESDDSDSDSDSDNNY